MIKQIKRWIEAFFEKGSDKKQHESNPSSESGEPVFIRHLITDENDNVARIMLDAEDCFFTSSVKTGTPSVIDGLHSEMTCNFLKMTAQEWGYPFAQFSSPDKCDKIFLTVQSICDQDFRFPHVVKASGGSIQEACERMMHILGNIIQKAESEPDGNIAPSIPCLQFFIDRLAEAMLGNGSLVDDIERENERKVKNKCQFENVQNNHTFIVSGSI